MANIADKVQQIREAVYGREVRESIASGIEAINSEVVSTTERQNKIDEQEQSRINAEAERQAQESIRQNQEKSRQIQEDQRIKTFNENEKKRDSVFNINESNRNSFFLENENKREDTFNTNETNRIRIFSQNEQEREDFLLQFKKWYEETQLTGRLPIYFDGGYFGRADDDRSFDGGDFGEK